MSRLLNNQKLITNTILCQRISAIKTIDHTKDYNSSPSISPALHLYEHLYELFDHRGISVLPKSQPTIHPGKNKIIQRSNNIIKTEYYTNTIIELETSMLLNLANILDLLARNILNIATFMSLVISTYDNSRQNDIFEKTNKNSKATI